MTSKVAEPTSIKKQFLTSDHKLKGEVQPKHNRDINCFKCQRLGHYTSECANHRVMILRDDEEIVFTSEKSDCDEMPPLEDVSDLKYAVGDKVLVIKRSLNVQTKEDDGEQQRKNIFHTRCLINDKVCSMIIDSDSCTNVVSVTLVRKLGLNTIKHERPYQLQWLNECGVVRVNRQVMISFSVGKYKDEVLCDVVPMYATHLLLMRPWQFDRKAKQDGFKNMYSLEKDGRIYTLAPLTPKQVYEDQIQLKKSYEEEHSALAKVKEQAKQHGENVRKSENKVSHELKTKGDKVSAFRKLGEGHDQKEKKREVESGEKKERVRKEEYVETIGKNLNFFAKSSDLKHAYLFELPMILLVCKEVYFNSDNLDSCVPSIVKVLLQEFEDVFPEEIPSGLPPIRGIEHQIRLCSRRIYTK